MRSLFLAMLLLAMGASAGKAHAKLHYFDVRGLAQPIRLLLSDLGIDFEEVRHTSDTWPTAKKEGIDNGLLTFGQVPALEITHEDGKKYSMVQSLAIMMHLGRTYKLYGSSEEDRIKVDVVAGGVMDVRKRYGAMAYNKETPNDPAILENYKKELKTFLDHFERILLTSGGDYVIGTEYTFADVMLYDLIDTCALRVDPSILDGLNALSAHR
eukprot:Sspe_Gene.92760::Locus_65551_Transcript_1_4_Confidence_0.400_Length_844::g.92760::m.92760/K00799/GST, gst; glutathione S-transferase